MPAKREASAAGAAEGGARAALRAATLTVYNAAQCAGWLLLAVKALQLAAAVYAGEVAAPLHEALWEHGRFGELLVALQWLSMAELPLVLLGVLRARIAAVAMQLLARNLVILLTVAPSPALHAHPSFAIFAAAWVLTEVVRFPLLLLKGVGAQPPRLLHTLRYTLFIVLYPMGGIGEVWAMLTAMQEGGTRDVLGLQLPLAAFIKYAYLPLFLPGFALLYTHMFAQRRARLASDGDEKRSKTA